MTVYEFYKSLSELYPTSLSCDWDNDGLMCCGDVNAEVKRVLVALDATNDCISYAEKNGFDLVLTHHPMIFKGLKTVSENSLHGNNVIRCIKSGVSVISLHTRLDAGMDGVNDALANALELNDVVPFGDDAEPEIGRMGTISPVSPEKFAALVRDKLGCTSVNAYIAKDKLISKVALVGGGANDFIFPALSAGADAFVCGECRYNTALEAADSGLTVIEAGHYHSEFPVCRRLSELARTLADAETEIYKIKSFTKI